MRLIIIASVLILLVFESKTQTYLSSLQNIKDYNNLSGNPLSDKYGQVSSVKVVYDIHSKKLYFINSQYFKYHFEFCNEILNKALELEMFNQVNYSNKTKRDYLLANINYYQTINKFGLEISPADLMPIEQMESLFKIVQSHTYFGNELYLLLNSARLLNQKNIFGGIPWINPSEIYANLTYQAVCRSKNYGKLKFIDNLDAEIENITSTDIIVLNSTPVYLPTVAGIIVSEFQTPLSHLSILGQNRKIPVCAYKLAFADSSLRKFENQNVLFSVNSDTFKLEIVKKTDLISRKPKPLELEADLSVNTLIDVKDLDHKSVKYAGNKASNFGILCKISKQTTFKVPEAAFAIPFYFYNCHIASAHAHSIINLITSNAEIRNNKDSLKYYLKQLQTKILETPLDSQFLKAVICKIQSFGDYSRMRFRSSTNAEDAKGFSGAGLYVSATGIVNSSKKSVENAIKEVWASLWSYEAFTEREYFNINHKMVYMGILVHRSFPSEGVNGVAITKNLYRKDNYGFVVNAQNGDESVVRPRKGNICDQFICYPNNSNIIYNNKNIVDVITISNLNHGNLVMTEKEIQNLADQLEVVKTYFLKHIYLGKSYFNLGLDIEFKLDSNTRELYFKQVRIYND